MVQNNIWKVESQRKKIDLIAILLLALLAWYNYPVIKNLFHFRFELRLLPKYRSQWDFNLKGI